MRRRRVNARAGRRDVARSRRPMPHPTTAFSRASHGRLTAHDLGRFEGDSLFDRIARAVCTAECLPRKELYEAWEMARRVRRVCRGGRVVDLGGGHGLLAHVMLLLDDTSPAALVVDPSLPPSHQRLHHALVAVWPRLDGRVTFVDGRIEDVSATAGDVIVSCHGCGRAHRRRTRSRDRRAGSRRRPAVLPRPRPLRNGRAVGLDAGRSGDRRDARGAAAPARLSHLDEDDPGRGHASQPAADRGAGRRGVKTSAAAQRGDGATSPRRRPS